MRIEKLNENKIRIFLNLGCTYNIQVKHNNIIQLKDSNLTQKR